jgi:hypothetical protein
LNDLRHRLRRLAPKHDLVSVIAYAFDHRTRMLPFIFADTRMAPAGHMVKKLVLPLSNARTSLLAQVHDKSGSGDPSLGSDCTHP